MRTLRRRGDRERQTMGVRRLVDDGQGGWREKARARVGGLVNEREERHRAHENSRAHGGRLGLCRNETVRGEAISSRGWAAGTMDSVLVGGSVESRARPA